MNRRKITKNTMPKKNTSQPDSIPWRYCLLTFVCGLILVGGFFGAARQHFSSIEFGIKNSKLRKQIEDLEAEKRRMLLTKEVVLSPGEIKKAAKKIGFTEMSASNIEVFRGNAEPAPKEAIVRKTVDSKPVREISTYSPLKKEIMVSERTSVKTQKQTEVKEKAEVKEKKEKPKTQLVKR
jgi:hypothetical protein